MKMKFLPFLLVIVFVSFIYSVNSSKGRIGTIIVEVSGLENDAGIVRSQLFDYSRANFFPVESKEALMRTTSNPKHKKARIIFENVPFDTYAISVHHDINNNGKMDRNFIGYPDEGFGLSNNPKIVLSVPDFDECKFKLDSPSKTIKIELKFAD